jgi:hypothetical protein
VISQEPVIRAQADSFAQCRQRSVVHPDPGMGTLDNLIETYSCSCPFSCCLFGSEVFGRSGVQES